MRICWRGPFKIIEMRSNHRYVVEEVGNKSYNTAGLKREIAIVDRINIHPISAEDTQLYEQRTTFSLANKLKRNNPTISNKPKRKLESIENFFPGELMVIRADKAIHVVKLLDIDETRKQPLTCQWLDVINKNETRERHRKRRLMWTEPIQYIDKISKTRPAPDKDADGNDLPWEPRYCHLSIADVILHPIILNEDETLPKTTITQIFKKSKPPPPLKKRKRRR